MGFRAGGLALLLAAAAVHAQAPEPLSANNLTPEFVRFLQSSFNRSAVDAVIRAQAAKLPGNCAEITIIPTFGVEVDVPPEFSPDGRKLVRGSWKEFVDAVACGAVRTHNVQTFVRPTDGALFRSAMLPGSSRASLALQTDAARIVYENLARQTSGDECGSKAYAIVNTKFLSVDPASIPNAKAGPNAHAWSEEWTTVACDRTLPLQVTFTPDAGGTSVEVFLSPAQ